MRKYRGVRKYRGMGIRLRIDLMWGRSKILMRVSGMLLMWAASSAVALDAQNDFKALVAQDKVKLKVWVEPNTDIVVSQKVHLFIEVSTFRWFAGGTQIAPFDVEGAVVLRREKFAVNSSRWEGGKSWATQRWTVAIYPQQSGLIEVPTIALTLTVAGQDNQPVTGTLLTPEVSFSATVPVAMQGQTDWIATSQFDVEERYDKSSDNLKPGDSLLRTINFNARDVAAMMLPAPKFESQEGLAVYHNPAEINDKVNRGDSLATRTESIRYFIERNGTYQLPALEFHWWNIQRQEMLTVRLPAKVISTLGEAAVLPNGADVPGLRANTESVANIGNGIIVLTAFVGFLGLVFIAYRIFNRLLHKRLQNHLTPSRAYLRGQFVSACRHTEYETAVAILYQWLDHPEQKISGRHRSESSVREWLHRLGEDQLCEQFNQLMKSTWGVGAGNGRGSGEGNGGNSRRYSATNEFENLLWRLDSLANDTGSLFGFGATVDLRLN